MERPDPTRYDRDVSRARVRIVAVPLVLLAGLSGATFGLAKAHLARPGAPKVAPGQKVALGDVYRGETVFTQSCAGCHGAGGKGGVGPRLIGLPISVGQVKAQIDAGGGSMPAKLVTGRNEQDVLAYVATLIASP
jgi:mono/diheme cytochrome c family protein